MKFITRAITFLGVIFLLSGCFEQKITYTINPDGSGKADISYITPLGALNSKIMQMGDSTTPPPLKEQLRVAAAKLIEKTKGVDVWKNVKYSFTKDGKVCFTGTAYFADFNKFHFNRDENSKKDANLVLKKEGGVLKLASAKPKKKGVSDSKSKPEKSPLQNKIDYQNAKGIMRVFLYDMKISNRYILPGKANSVTGFKKLNANTLTFSIDGKDILKAIDKLANDNKYSKKDFEISKDTDITSLMPDMKKSVEVKGAMKPLFNYKKEVAAAKREWKAEEKVLSTPILAKGEKKIKLPTKIEKKPETLKATTKAKLVGSKFYTKGTPQEQKDFYLFHSSLQLSVIQPLPSKATAVTKAVLTKAVMMDGEDVTGEKKWDREINFPRISKDGKSVLLEVKLKIPKNPNSGLKVLEGTIEYQNNSGEKVVDLGLIPLKKGASGKALGAKITKAVKKKTDEDDIGFSLELKINKNYIIGLEFYDKNGKKVDVKSAGASYSDNSVTYYLKTGKKLPESLNIKAKAYTKSEKKTTTFSLKNIDLFGNEISK
jgi:hypothetical protein